jgi:tetraacyldisaccharide 4'-kinase
VSVPSPPPALRGLLAPAALLYGLVILARNGLYRLGGLPSEALPRPVVSVGNLTAGGTGKTPMVRALFERLRRQGHRPAVLLRGYAAGPGRSDEAAELEASLRSDPAAPAPVVMADPDRRRGAARALARDSGVSVFLLDDGFQHRRVRRDLDLVLVDATQPFRENHLLPWGTLREPHRALRRADRILVTRADGATRAGRAALAEDLQRAAGRAADAWCAHQWQGLRRHDGTDVGLQLLRARRVLLFCGLGNPRAFLETAQRHGAVVANHVFFRDHHSYSREDRRALKERARACGAEALLTSEKDFQRLPSDGAADWPIYRPVLGLRWMEGEDAIDRALREAVGAPPNAAEAPHAAPADEA